MNKLNMYEKGWVVGMLEGEAAVGAWAPNQHRDVSSKNTKYARVEISSVDHEVVYKLQELTGLGNINEQYAGNEKHKHSITWRVAKAEEVLDLLMLWASAPFVSEHRRTQIMDAVEAASTVAMRKSSGESFSRKRT